MKQRRSVAFVLAVLLALVTGANSVAAAPQANPFDGWSSITIWAYLDQDSNGVFTAGEPLLHEVGACLTSRREGWTSCGATDYGDVWWEPLVGGIFVARIDVNDPEIPAGYRLTAISCNSTIPEKNGKDCVVKLHKAEAQFKQLAGEFTNIYFGFAP